MSRLIVDYRNLNLKTWRYNLYINIHNPLRVKVGMIILCKIGEPWCTVLSSHMTPPPDRQRSTAQCSRLVPDIQMSCLVKLRESDSVLVVSQIPQNTQIVDLLMEALQAFMMIQMFYRNTDTSPFLYSVFSFKYKLQWNAPLITKCLVLVSLHSKRAMSVCQSSVI